jgi:Kef-type K+ transport system membrane component KefB
MALDILVQLTVILSVAVVAHLIMSWIKQPSVVGELLIGIVLGPSLIGQFTDEPLFAEETIELFAHFGGIILLFLIGLETKLSVVGNKKAISVAFGGVIVPWLAGYGMAVLFNYPGPEAIFIGATLTATSVGVTAMVLMEMNAVSTNIGRTIIGAAVVDDILAMIALTIAEGVALENVINPFAVAKVSIIAVIFIAVGAFAGIKVLNPLILKAHRLGQKRGLHSIGFMLALSLALLYAFIAETIGLSAIIGAFLAGTVLEPSELKRHFTRQTQALGMIFIPVFFVALGLLVDLRLLQTAFVFIMMLTLLAVFTKIVGCGLPARLFGDSGHDSFTIGYGMVPRGEIALVMALVGLQAGVIDNALYSSIVIMAILTTVVVPSVLAVLLKQKPVEDDVIVPIGDPKPTEAKDEDEEPLGQGHPEPEEEAPPKKIGKKAKGKKKG